MTADEFTKALDQLEMTHEAAALRLGVNRTTIWRWARGKRPIPKYLDLIIRSWRRQTLERSTP